MAKTSSLTRKALRDPWVRAVIIADIVGVCAIAIAVPQAIDDAESLGAFLRLLLELAKLAS